LWELFVILSYRSFCHYLQPTPPSQPQAPAAVQTRVDIIASGNINQTPPPSPTILSDNTLSNDSGSGQGVSDERAVVAREVSGGGDVIIWCVYLYFYLLVLFLFLPYIVLSVYEVC
jgi:hypothetical protein